ncbi:MAG: ComF family protein [Deltaproteobacteria bacterium]|nr:ComF family protein [Deltaproteobacteria bacterium]
MKRFPRRWRQWWRVAQTWCADLCYPRRCCCCDQVLAADPLAVLCSSCCAGIQWINGRVTRAAFPAPKWERLLAVSRFDGPIVDALHRLKYERRLDLAPSLARLMMPLVSARGEIDLIVPVPLSAERLRQRGYNQAQQIAQTIGETWHSPVRTGLLVRRRATPPQVGLSSTARLENVRNAFALTPRGITVVPKQQVLLLDDVMTTGATLHECATVLVRHGAVVTAMAVAVA